MRRRLAAEALGTFALIFAGTGAIVVNDMTGAVTHVGIALTFGLVVMALIYALGDVSGAHFNPAVTLAMMLKRNISPAIAALYIAVQILGAVAGVFAAHAMFAEPILQVSTHLRDGPSQAWSELIATFGLMATILGVSRFRPEFTAIAVGLYITSAYWFTASTSFANPAVTLARSLSDTFAGIAPTSVPAFLAAQILGALIAVRLFGWLLQPPPP